MINFFQKFIIAIVSAATAFTAALHGVPSSGPSTAMSTSTSSALQIQSTTTIPGIATSSDLEATTSSEIEQLQLSIAQQQAAQSKLEKELTSMSQNKPSGASATNAASHPPAGVSTSQGFLTPSGAVVDSSGNIISSAQNTTEQAPVAGETKLTPEEIVADVSPSVAWIQTPTELGSGIVIDGGKYILTDAHVVGNNTLVQISLPGGTFQAPVIGTNTDVDLAIIYSGGQGAQAATLGSSGSLAIGDTVYALGYPLSSPTFNLTNLTLSQGILSARQIPTGSTITMLQTDTAINPGNSGGPLVNSEGQVVGIIESKIDGTEVSGIGFATPIDTAEAYIPSLSDNGQSRYELHPLGSTIDIPASVINRLEINPQVNCDQLAFTTSEESMCQFYRDYKDQYNWNILQNE